MHRLTVKDIDSFYNLVEEANGQSLIENLTEEQIDVVCEKAIQDIQNNFNVLKDYLKNNRDVKGRVFTPLRILKMEKDLPIKSKEIHEDKILEECKLYYHKGVSVEHCIWMSAMITMSWTLRNLKGKTEIGSCHNLDHPHGSTTPRLCPVGSSFHKDFYKDCLDSFKEILRIAEENQPVQVKDTTR